MRGCEFLDVGEGATSEEDVARDFAEQREAQDGATQLNQLPLIERRRDATRPQA